MDFVEFTRWLAGQDYPLPPDWPVPREDDIILVHKDHGPMTPAEAAQFLFLPTDAFRWCWTCWRHHNSISATQH
jgi:hypothetical protein